jgi:glyoxylate utilization-related uncharacterized protein
LEERPTAHLIELPRIEDARGNLTPVEARRHVPFAIRRVYWIYNVPGGEKRGGHAYRQLEEALIALSGSFEVVVDDGDSTQRFALNRSYMALYVPALAWRQIENFSTNGVCLVLASRPYAEGDYVRDRTAFERLVGAG